MNLLTQQNIRPPGRDETVFRISLWGALFGFVIFLIGLLVGVGFFIYSIRSSNAGGMALSGLYTLVMWGISHLLFRTLKANRSPANWLARIGPGGILLKYRSYLHDDSPGEDPIALQLAWSEIIHAQLLREILSTSDAEGNHRMLRWFLVLQLDQRHLNLDAIKAALDFESRRKPAHFKVDELKHELFIARKNKVSEAEIARIQQQISLEKQRHPGKHSKMRLRDRPLVYLPPDQLKMEWTQSTPGKRRLRQLLGQYTAVLDDEQRALNVNQSMTETEFKAQLDSLLSRDEKIEAIKLVRLKMGLSLSEARRFVETHSAGEPL